MYNEPCTQLFTEKSLMAQLVDNPTHISDIAGQTPHLPEVFLTTHQQKYFTFVQHFIGSSDHCVVETAGQLSMKDLL